MKKKLVMLLIGSMILGMVGCTNKGNEIIDNNKETIQEPETTETEPETEKIDATVDELLGNVIFCDFNKTVYTADGVGKLMFIPGKVDFELTYKTVTVYDSEVEYEEVENKFFELIERPYIKRVAILGGEPLANENVSDVFNLIKKLKVKFPDKSIWLYTGYKWDGIVRPVLTDDFNPERDRIIDRRKKVVEMCDVLIDGRFVEGLKDLTLKFRGSSNQRIISIQESLKENKIVLYN